MIGEEKGCFSDLDLLRSWEHRWNRSARSAADPRPAPLGQRDCALTLKVVSSLSTAAAARAFLTSEVTLGQRLLRAKRKIASAGIPYQVLPAELLAERLDGVLAAVYLLFTEGYAATADDTLAEGVDPPRRVARRADPGLGRGAGVDRPISVASDAPLTRGLHATGPPRRPRAPHPPRRGCCPVRPARASATRRSPAQPGARRPPVPAAASPVASRHSWVW